MTNDKSLPAKDLYVVDKSDEAAMAVVRKICTERRKFGAMVPVTHEEFEALKGAVIRIELPQPEEVGAVEGDPARSQAEEVLIPLICPNAECKEQIDPPFAIEDKQIQCPHCDHLAHRDKFALVQEKKEWRRSR